MIIKILLIIFCAFILYFPYFLYTTKIFDFGVFKQRKNFEYQHVFVTRTGFIYVDDERMTTENMENFRLSNESIIKNNLIDHRLIEMMMFNEGDDDAQTVYKGFLKGLITYTGLKTMGGGSTLSMSVAGSLLGDRQSLTFSFIQKFKEIILSGYLNNLDVKDKKALIMSEACSFGHIVGCPLVAAQLFNRTTLNDRQRVILLASIRYNLSNTDKALKYANNLCQSKLKETFNIRDCHPFKPHEFKSARKEGLPMHTTILMNHHHNDVARRFIPFADRLVMLNVLKNVQSNMNNNVEISIMDQHQNLIVFSDNAFISRAGFGQNNIASVAKLLPLLLNTNYGVELVKPMATSDNKQVKSIFEPKLNMFELRQVIENLGLSVHNLGSDVHNLSEGHVSMSSKHVHFLMLALSKKKLHSAVMTAAIHHPEGTLHHLNAFLKNQGFVALVAKSGTHAQRTIKPYGVYGKLIAMTIKHSKTSNIYSVLIRIHSKKTTTPICTEDGCIDDQATFFSNAAIKMVSTLNQTQTKR